MKGPGHEVELIPDGGLAALLELRRSGVGGAAAASRHRADIVDPNEIRLQRMLSTERYLYGVKTPFIARRDELERLYNTVRDAVTHGRLQVVNVVGEPGSGKTRLLAETFAIIDPVERGIVVLPLACSPDDDSDSVIAQLVRRRFGIVPSDRDAAARDKIVEGIEPHVEARALSASARLFGFLAGLRASGPSLYAAAPVDVMQLRRSAIRHLVVLLERDLATAPHIVVVHRAHHLGAAAREVLASLAQELSDRPLVLVFVGRGAVELTAAGGGVPSSTIEVGRLSDRDIERQVRALLHAVEEVPDALVERLVACSSGIPRLAEENIRLLVQRGLVVPGEGSWTVRAERLPSAAELASTIQAASGARIEALDATQRSVLGLASVFGYSFWVGGVVALLRALEPARGLGRPWIDRGLEEEIRGVLRRLEQDGLVVPQERSALTGDDELTFAHERDRNRLYAALASERREAAHRLAAQWLTTLANDEASAWHEGIALHWEQGGRPVDAAAALMRAAQVARDGYAMARALGLLRRALTLLDVDQAGLLARCLSQVGDLSLRTGDFRSARAAFGATLEATLLTCDLRAGAGAWLNLGKAHLALGDYGAARECLAHAGELYRHVNHSLGVAAATDQLAKVFWLEGGQGALDQALTHASRALEVRRRLGHPRPIAESLGNLANIRIQRGELSDARELLEEALQLRLQIGDLGGQATCRVGLGAVQYTLGHLEEAIATWREGLDVAELVGDRDLIGALLNNLGESYLELGQLDAAAASLGEAQEVTAETGDQRTAADVTRNLAALAAARGDYPEAQRQIEVATAICEAIGSRSALAHVLRTRGEILSHRAAAGEPGASPEAATACFDQAITSFLSLGDRVELERAVHAYADHLRRHHEEDKAVEVLRILRGED